MADPLGVIEETAHLARKRGGLNDDEVMSVLDALVRIREHERVQRDVLEVAAGEDWRGLRKRAREVLARCPDCGEQLYLSEPCNCEDPDEVALLYCVSEDCGYTRKAPR